jgi:hypothetical protein
MHCEVGDVVTVSHDVSEWTNKEFRILEIAEEENDEMKITAQEYNEAIYSDDGVVKQISSDTSLPNPFAEPDSVTNLSLVEEAEVLGDGTWVPRIKVSWTRPDYIIWNSANIYISNDDGATWNYITKVSAEEYIIKELSPDTYKVKVVSESKQQRKEDFGLAVAGQITVHGKDSNPSDVNWGTCNFKDEIILRWQPISDNDLKAYEIRTDENWGNDDSSLIYRGDGLKANIDDPTQRTYTFHIKALDRSGNYSTNKSTKTLTNSAPAAPNFTADNITEFFSAIQIRIPEVSGATGYKLYITPSDGSGNATGDTEIIPLNTAQSITYNVGSGDSALIKIGTYDSLTSIMNDENISSEIEATASTIDNISEFAANLKPIKIVDSLPALPDSNYPQGTPIFLTTDNKIYRSTGSEWTTEVNEDDIVDGSITTDKLIANAITTGKIQAGAIAADEIAADAIIAEKIGTNEVIAYSANIKNGIIQTAHIQDAAITNAKIDNLDAGKINAGTLTLTGNMKIQSQDGSIFLDANKFKSVGATGAYSLLDDESLKFYDENGDLNWYSKKVAYGTAQDGDYITLNWTQEPKVQTAIKALKTYSSTATGDQEYQSYPSGISADGFYVYGKSVIPSQKGNISEFSATNVNAPATFYSGYSRTNATKISYYVQANCFDSTSWNNTGYMKCKVYYQVNGGSWALYKDYSSFIHSVYGEISGLSPNEYRFKIYIYDTREVSEGKDGTDKEGDTITTEDATLDSVTSEFYDWAEETIDNGEVMWIAIQGGA